MPGSRAAAASLAVSIGALVAACGGVSSRSSVPRPPATGESAVLGEAALANKRYPPAPATAQTHPLTSPARGTSTTTFTVALTARRTLGVSGTGRYGYELLLAGPRPRCTEFTEVTHAARAARVQVRLVAPLVTGWCLGDFRGTVLLDEEPYCPPPPAGGPIHACRLFATRLLDVGHFSFVVGSPPR
jgi:hypothetical protein